MKRFVESFYDDYEWISFEDRINEYAKKHNLEIIQIAPVFGQGIRMCIYVLFEEKGGVQE